MFAHLFQALFWQPLDAHIVISRIMRGANEFIELGLESGTVPILCVLDKEHHQEGHDGRAGIDDQLPGVGIFEDRSGHRPHHDWRKTELKA